MGETVGLLHPLPLSAVFRFLPSVEGERVAAVNASGRLAAQRATSSHREEAHPRPAVPSADACGSAAVGLTLTLHSRATRSHACVVGANAPWRRLGLVRGWCGDPERPGYEGSAAGRVVGQRYQDHHGLAEHWVQEGRLPERGRGCQPTLLAPSPLQHAEMSWQ